MGDEPDSNSGSVTSAASSGSLKSKVSDFLGKSGGEKKGGSQQGPASRYAAIPSSLKKGGKIRKTGYAKVHKGEKVLTKRQQKKRGGRKS